MGFIRFLLKLFRPVYIIFTCVCFVFLVGFVIVLANGYEGLHSAVNIGLFLSLAWLYVTGILLVVRSVNLLRGGSIIDGVVVLLLGLLILVSAYHVVYGFLIYVIYSV